jgi:hypothetical protein
MVNRMNTVKVIICPISVALMPTVYSPISARWQGYALTRPFS